MQHTPAQQHQHCCKGKLQQLALHFRTAHDLDEVAEHVHEPALHLGDHLAEARSVVKDSLQQRRQKEVHERRSCLLYAAGTYAAGTGINAAGT
eukprot:scaffold126410_cov23-Tisochrysis_lutea.AAC.1